MCLNFSIDRMIKALKGEHHVMPEGLTREQFRESMSGRFKVANEGMNINPRLAFNPLPKIPPKAPPAVSK